MDKYNIYKDISERTDGDIYIGVVGPVRTGKSTFIKRFMELLVLPNIENTYRKERANDELPQCGAGRTITTTEPKFVPSEAVELKLKDNLKFKVRLVDCVGYLVKGVLGHEENNMPRMVNTPWYEEEIPFEEAAEIGTKKVITDHSTIGIVVTTDGSISDIERPNYIKAEERVVNELKELEKPFVIVLNTRNPDSDSAIALRESLEEKYNVPVIAADCLNMTMDDINSIFEKVLLEFPIREININLPGWVEGLSKDHWIQTSIINAIKGTVNNLYRLSDINPAINKFKDAEVVEDVRLTEINLGEGVASVEIGIDNNLYYEVISEMTGYNIKGEHQILALMDKLAKAKREYDKVEKALNDVKETGYGLVAPSLEELELLEPEVVKQGNRFGVKLRANAPSLHLIRADITTEVSPIIGTEKQSEELINYLLEEFENDPSKIWESNMFGKSLHDLVKEQLQSKLNMMPENARSKIQRTLQKIVNEGNKGLICIIV
ncbi:stage IV sporulation protein A [Thermohalobacter berrensis]|uniref:Stage IV sporulation protein A n=1 Tax=Thermohalobacter berrensis TaxID=99594 RepID=A0A419TA34_9FIRM|nr:stage IV sporulation protein A [Thermohalobacter berrensis]RKD34326.1 stage IV sporulation protein A [Thermohalobacter berrensis]